MRCDAYPDGIPTEVLHAKKIDGEICRDNIGFKKKQDIPPADKGYVVFLYPKLVITGQPEIYEPNGAKVTPSKFLRESCFYIVRKPYDV